MSDFEQRMRKGVADTDEQFHEFVQYQNRSNTFGIVGFILAIVALLISWIPIIGSLVWLLGAIFSIIGLFRRPRGLAIAGTIISFIGLVFLIFIFIGIGLIGSYWLG